MAGELDRKSSCTAEAGRHDFSDLIGTPPERWVGVIANPANSQPILSKTRLDSRLRGNDRLQKPASPIVVKSIIAVLTVLALLLLSACSPYSFNPGGKSSIKTIAIERFENQTSEYALSDRMTDIVIDAFIANGTIKVVSREIADAYLTGMLTRYERRPFEYDENDQVTSYVVQMDFDIALHDTKTDTEMWKESVRQSGQYDPVAETEEVGQQKALALLVTAVINRTTKAW